MKELVKIGTHTVLRGATVEEYNSIMAKRLTPEERESYWDFPLSEMEDNTVEDNERIYVELEMGGEKRYFETPISKYNFKPYDLFGLLNSENFPGCTSICKYYVEEFNDTVVSIVFENIHHLIGGLQATHEYSALISATTLEVYNIDEVAHGSWWDWDLNSLNDTEKAICDKMVRFAKTWLDLEKSLKNKNK